MGVQVAEYVLPLGTRVTIRPQCETWFADWCDHTGEVAVITRNDLSRTPHFRHPNEGAWRYQLTWPDGSTSGAARGVLEMIGACNE